MYIFISHSSTDALIASKLCDLIEENGSQCFLAPRNIRSGFEYAAEIINGIDNSDAMLLLLSKNANTSPHILREIERAVSKSIPIIVYKLEEVELSKSMEYFLMTHQWLNADFGTHEQLLSCIEDIKNNKSKAFGQVVVPNKPSKEKKKSKLPIILAGTAIATIAVLATLLITAPKSNTTNGNKIEINTSNNNSSNNNSSNNNTSQDSNTTSTVDVKLGDTVVFGKYNDADIAWQVIKLSDDGTEAVLISKDILTFKAFDSANTGNFARKDNTYYSSRDEIIQTDKQLQADVFGNSSWKNSDLRAWLNSTKSTVEYEGLGPINSALSDSGNAYNLEAGFLYNFSDKELSAIKETKISTKGNAINPNDTIITNDKVYVLSVDEMKWLENADVSKLATPTKEAIEKNQSTFYKEYCQDVFKTDTSPYWLRDSVHGSSSEVYQIGHGASPKYPDNIFTAIACCNGYGVRPVITVDLTSDCISAEE